MKHSLYAAIAGLVIILTACDKKETTPQPTPVTNDPMTPVEILAEGKGFKKLFGYIEPNTLLFEGSISKIEGLDLSIRNSNSLYYAFKLTNIGQQGETYGIMRGAVNPLNASVISNTSSFPYIRSNNAGNERFSFAPYSGQLVYSYYISTGFGATFNATGDINETSPERGEGPRIGKYPHFIFAPKGSPNGSNWYTYGYTKSDGTSIGFTYAPTVFDNYHKGIFEVIPNSDFGVLAVFRADSVVTLLQTLSTPLVKPTRLSRVKVSGTIPLDNFGGTFIKNNENSDNFTFGCYTRTQGGPIQVWTFKYDHSTKTTSKVIDGMQLPASVTSLTVADLDADGYLYYFAGNAVSKVTSSVILTVGSPNLLQRGNADVLKWYNGKVYLLASNYANSSSGTTVQGRRQMDILMQE